MFEGRYNYTQAAAKCSAEGAVLAMASDQDTFDALFKIVDVYTRRQGGSIDGAFLDGFKSTAAGDWFCVNSIW